MAEDEAPDQPGKRSKMPMIIGLVLALVGGGGGFFAVTSGLLFGGESSSPTAEAEVEIPGAGLPHVASSANVVFVPVEPLTISLGPNSSARHLVFRAQLEVPTASEATVRTLMPRVVDILNSYLRAVEPRDFEQPGALTRLRAQMLRRVQTVLGPENVRDLLVMEFVLN